MGMSRAILVIRGSRDKPLSTEELTSQTSKLTFVIGEPQSIRVLREPPQDGFTNMARDSALLDAAEQGSVGGRIYSWDGVWVSVGRFQSVERDIVQPDQVQWVRRPTGGKAVLHGHDVTIGCAIPLSLIEATNHRSIKAIYRVAVSPIVEALSACGLNAALAEDTEFSGKGVHSGDCFAFSSPNDIVDQETGRKICGCALRLTERAVLLQASVPNGEPLVEPASVILNADHLEPVIWTSQGIEIAFERALQRLVTHP